MNQIVPPRFLFRWAFTAKKIEKLPKSTGRLLDLPDTCELPSIAELDNQKSFATLKMAWNNNGLGLSLTVSDRTRRPECVASELLLSDGMRIWINTRNNQTIHRANKFCHYFVLLPAGAGSKKTAPLVRSLPIARSREDSQLPPAELVKIQSENTSTGYWLEAWFPAEVFVGFDPETNPKLGFHYVVHDTEQGEQTLAVGKEFPYDSDPSLWQTVDLIS